MPPDALQIKLPGLGLLVPREDPLTGGKGGRGCERREKRERGGRGGGGETDQGGRDGRNTGNRLWKTMVISLQENRAKGMGNFEPISSSRLVLDGGPL